MNICDNCVNDSCQMQSGIERQNCEFYKELKPCPLCGGEAEVLRAVKEICWCKCKKCDVSTCATCGEHNAIEAWNRRVEK